MSCMYVMHVCMGVFLLQEELARKTNEFRAEHERLEAEKVTCQLPRFPVSVRLIGSLPAVPCVCLSFVRDRYETNHSCVCFSVCSSGFSV